MLAALVGVGLIGVGCAKPRARAAASTPNAVTTMMRRQILNAADAGEGDPVANRLRQQVAAEAGNVALRLELAAHYGQRGLPELELEYLRLAVERFPASAEARLALARKLRQSGQPQQGADILELFLRAQEADSNGGVMAPDPELLNLLGICLDDAGDWAAGEQVFRQALAVAPEQDYLHNNLGYNLLRQDRPREAIAAFAEALKRNPKSEAAHNNWGLALARSGGVGEALKHFQAVADPATANSNLAAALIEQSRWQESRQLLEAALDGSRSHAAALANLKLVSELDGKPATVRARHNHNNPLLWPWLGFRWLFLPE